MTAAPAILPGTPLTPAEFDAIRAACAAGARQNDLARAYNLSDAYVSRIGKGTARRPVGLRSSTPRGMTFKQRARRCLSLAEYQEIRAIWNAGLRGIGLNPDNLPEDFTVASIMGELRECGYPTQKDIAARFRTSACTVSEIVRGLRRHRDERGAA